MSERICEWCREQPARKHRRLCVRCLRSGVTVGNLGATPARLVPAGQYSWHAQAACRNSDPDLWWPPEGTDIRTVEGRRLVATAVRICQSCPVRKTCLDQALKNSEPDGIWGGLTYHQRRDLQTKRGNAARQALQVVAALAGAAT